jgi:multidrug efflux pump subunit AcrA (membrane-fusion protein)
MISDQNFQIQTYVSEADIGKIQVGENATITLDTYGNSVIFPATIIAIDPSSTVQNGINTYKTTLQFNEADDRIKEGMDANILLTGQTHNNALVVPSNSIITKDNQNFVLTENKPGDAGMTPVQTGFSSLDGSTEILSGVGNNQEVVFFGNTK